MCLKKAFHYLCLLWFERECNFCVLSCWSAVSQQAVKKWKGIGHSELAALFSGCIKGLSQKHRGSVFLYGPDFLHTVRRGGKHSPHRSLLYKLKHSTWIICYSQLQFGLAPLSISPTQRCYADSGAKRRGLAVPKWQEESSFTEDKCLLVSI